MNSNIIIAFSGDDILLPKLLRRYITEAKKLKGYESTASFAQNVLDKIESEKNLRMLPISFEEWRLSGDNKITEYHIS